MPNLLGDPQGFAPCVEGFLAWCQDFAEEQQDEHPLAAARYLGMINSYEQTDQQKLAALERVMRADWLTLDTDFTISEVLIAVGEDDGPATLNQLLLWWRQNRPRWRRPHERRRIAKLRAKARDPSVTTAEAAAFAAKADELEWRT